jgi:RND family efflux transporter MFP subunit
MQFSFNRFLFFIVLALAALFFSACGGSSAQTKNNQNAPAAPQIVEVSTAKAEQRALPQYFEATGSLASDLQTDVAPTVGGKVVAVNFDVGSFVTKGSVLVQLDDRDARIRLEQAQAQVQQAQSQVNQFRANVEQARSNVAQTQARLGLSGNTVFNVNNVAEVRSAKAALDLAEAQLKRNERLLESGDVSRSQYDTVKTQRDTARSQYEAALNAANQSFAAIRTAQAAVDQANAQVVTGQRAVEAAQTQVQAAQKAIADAVIYSPVTGYVQERVADPGEFIGTQNKIATIVRTNPLRMKIDIPEQSIASVRVGQSVSLRTSAYPDRNFSGTIARVVPGLNPTSRTLTAEAEIGNEQGLLKPGQFATVRILLPESRQVVMIPVRAVRQDGTINRVFVIENGFAREQIVQLGDAEGDLIEVKNGIAPNAQIAVSNLEKLFDGAKVQ